MYRIYRNLHKKCFSIQAKVPGKGWRVVDSATDLCVSGVTFRVYEAGRQRVLRTRRKNVHAFVIVDGYVKTKPGIKVANCDVKVSYNPKVAPVFLAGDVGVLGARCGHLTGGQMFVSHDWW